MPWPWGSGGGSRPDETPLRTVSGVIAPERSPGTPPSPPQQGARVGIISPSEVRQTKFSNRFRRILNLLAATGFEGYPAGLFASLPVSTFGDENYYPEDLLLWQFVSLGAVAGNFSTIGIINQAGSNVLAIVVAEVWRRTAAGEIQVFDNSPNALPLVGIPIVGGAHPRDLRMGTQLVGPSRVSAAAANTVAGAVSVQLSLGASGLFAPTWKSPVFILPPNTSIAFQPDAVAQGIAMNWYHREIQLPPT